MGAGVVVPGVLASPYEDPLEGRCNSSPNRKQNSWQKHPRTRTHTRTHTGARTHTHTRLHTHTHPVAEEIQSRSLTLTWAFLFASFWNAES